MRRYSLSDAPSPDHYRISVKREAGTGEGAGAGAHPAGRLSTLLHDTVREGDTLELAHPFGEFVLAAGTAPTVLLSAGVGATPLVAMLNTLLAEFESYQQIHTENGTSTRTVCQCCGAKEEGRNTYQLISASN